MSIDERQLDELVAESQDLQSDALRDAKASLPMLAERREARRKEEFDPFALAEFVGKRRSLITKLGLTGGLGALVAGILAQPASAADGIDVQILQTASSLEKLAVATYGAALTLPFIKDGNKVVVKFAETTMSQHDAHRKAFQAQTSALRGKVQDSPNPKYAPVVEAAKPTLKTPLDVVKLAATLEQVARDTYLSDLSQFTDKKSKEVMASVMGVETQHLTTLRAVAALLQANAADAIAIPVDPFKLPAAAGTAPFPDVIPMATMASPAEEGALK
jgi:rubrerythrin